MTFAHYREADSRLAQQAAHDLEAVLIRSGVRRENVLVVCTAMPGSPRHVCDWTPSEPVILADGVVDQSLIPGVAPISMVIRMIEAETLRRDAKRQHADLPSGGLFDETAKAQRSLF